MNRAERRRAAREKKKAQKGGKPLVMTLSPEADDGNPCPNGHPDQMIRIMNGLPPVRCARCGEIPTFMPMPE